jgi:hypothetical protein
VAGEYRLIVLPPERDHVVGQVEVVDLHALHVLGRAGQPPALTTWGGVGKAKQAGRHYRRAVPEGNPNLAGVDP